MGAEKTQKAAQNNTELKPGFRVRLIREYMQKARHVKSNVKASEADLCEPAHEIRP